MGTVTDVVLLGPPGAGKGTQAERLRAEREALHLATGDILRAAVASGTHLGREAEAYMTAGELVPDDVIIGVILDALRGADPERGFLLDGFPRTVAQAEALTAALADLGRTNTVAVLIDTPDDEVVRRISGRRVSSTTGRVYHVDFSPPAVPGVCDVDGSPLVQRDDDHEDTVRKRLAVYHAQTGPVAEFYAAQGVLHRIDGRSEPGAIAGEIEAILN